MLSLSRLESILDTLPRLTIGLVGDLFLDRYLDIAPGICEMSIETGLEAYQIPQIRNSPGALGTVLNNLAALGVGLLVPATVIGDDGHGFDLLKEVRKLPVDTSHILAMSDRLTPTYTKPMKQDLRRVWQELNRLDVRTRGPLSSAATDELCRRVRQVFESSDGLIVLDQINETDWGVVNSQVRDLLRELASENPKKLIYIDSRQYLKEFDFGILKGNRAELQRAAGAVSDPGAMTDETVREAALLLASRTSRPVFCTMGEQGILVTHPEQSPILVPGVPVTGSVDIVGAGDAATSGIVTSLLAGATPLEAAAVGNLVASITVQQLGTTGIASPEQVRGRWKEAQAIMPLR
ncbi:MAG: bifunctional heptose 7-phosphate kinase/heptose 1-phosphate adenyltransferase [Pirellulaceae bacterium]